jgi:hypothetical protein
MKICALLTMQLTRKGAIGSLDVHQNLATQVLNEERIRKGLADIVYQFISKGLQSELRV